MTLRVNTPAVLDTGLHCHKYIGLPYKWVPPQLILNALTTGGEGWPG